MKRRFATVAVLIVAFSLLLPADSEAFIDLPNGFSDTTVVGNVPSPTAIDWLEGDLLITAQAGVLFRWDGADDADPVLDLKDTVCSGDETGLLGVAVVPEFDSGQRFVYLYYTGKRNGQCNASHRANRVSRFAVAENGDIGNEDVLIDNIPAPGGNHNAGDLHFGKDGLLYVSVGDGGVSLKTGKGQDDNGNARSLSLLNGKILRIEADGSVPASNPFTGEGTVSCAAAGQAVGGDAHAQAIKKQKHHHKGGKRKHRKHQSPGLATICQEIFATGLRNPFRFAMDPDDDSGQQRLFINDVGGGAWEEIDELDDGDAGTDYGWNVREGPCTAGSTSNCTPDNRFQEPISAYQHSGGCETITGGAFVPDNGEWPDEFDDVYLYADFGCDTLFALQDDGSSVAPFGTGTTAVHLAFGPDGDLYYTSYFDGEVRKIEYTP